MNKVKRQARFSHLTETDNQRDRDRGEAEERGRGPVEREPHTGGKKRDNTLLQNSDSERQGQRTDWELSSLTDAQQERGERRELGVSVTHSSNFKPAQTKQEKQRERGRRKEESPDSLTFSFFVNCISWISLESRTDVFFCLISVVIYSFCTKHFDSFYSASSALLLSSSLDLRT